MALPLTAHKVYDSGNQIKTNEMSRAYRTYEEEERCIQVFGGEPEVRSHLEDLGAEGIIILVRTFKKWDGELLDWIDAAQDRDRFRALVNTVMNLRAP
jgi:hypothetical protein